LAWTFTTTNTTTKTEMAWTFTTTNGTMNSRCGRLAWTFTTANTSIISRAVDSSNFGTITNSDAGTITNSNAGTRSQDIDAVGVTHKSTSTICCWRNFVCGHR
jgi:hypothetical protein